MCTKLKLSRFCYRVRWKGEMAHVQSTITLLVITFFDPDGRMGIVVPPPMITVGNRLVG